MTSPILERIRRCLETGDASEVNAPAAIADAARAVLAVIPSCPLWTPSARCGDRGRGLSPRMVTRSCRRVRVYRPRS